MSRLLLTGGTGTVGSSLVPFLRESGYEITFLTRPSGAMQAKERIKQVVASLASSDGFISGDLNLPLAGVSDKDLNAWRGRFDGILHCAASISFDEIHRHTTRSLNITGTENLLTLATALRIPHFHHLSTVYVAGDAVIFSEQDLFAGQKLRNVYEESKAEGEKVVRDWRGGNWTIYRLSCCIGDSATGYSPSFNGYFGFFKGVSFLKNKIVDKYDRMRTSLEPNGVSLCNEWLTLPVTLDSSPTSTLNLITSDWMASILVAAVKKPAAGKTFHIAHNAPPLVQEVIELSMEHLRIRGVRFKWRDGLSDIANKPFLARIQQQLDDRINRFLPYITHEARFLTAELQEHLGRVYVPHPPITRETYAKMLAFAVDHKFGKIRPNPERVNNSPPSYLPQSLMQQD